MVGIMLEERDLMHQFGEEYQRYRRRVSMLIPFWRKSPPDAVGQRTPAQPG
jgi:hypothetical protein